MKKKFLIVVFTLIMMVSLASCNKVMWDTNYHFDEAIIKLPNGEIIQDEVVNWTDYSDGDQIQVTLKDGNTYLCHAVNIVLISKG